MSNLDCEVEAAKLLRQTLQCLSHLALGLPILPDVVDEMDIRLAPAADKRVLMTNLAKEWTCVEVAAGATEVDSLAVKIHRITFPRVLLASADGS